MYIKKIKKRVEGTERLEGDPVPILGIAPKDLASMVPIQCIHACSKATPAGTRLFPALAQSRKRESCALGPKPLVRDTGPGE